MRHFLSRSADSLRLLGIAAHDAEDTARLHELLSELSFRTSLEARRVAALLTDLVDTLESNASEPPARRDGLEPPRQWHAGVRALASQFRARSAGTRTVYLVLLHNTEQPMPFGVYVGKTGLTAEERFANHKSGYKTKRYMKRDAVRLLKPDFDHLREISDDDATEIEPALAQALRDAGYWVKGGH